jgi:hypothetical protein
MAPENLRFKQVKDTGKTAVWGVQSVHNDVWLGRVKWHSPWRRYVYLPEPDTLYDKECLDEIRRFIETEMDRRWS